MKILIWILVAYVIISICTISSLICAIVLLKRKNKDKKHNYTFNNDKEMLQ